MLTNLDGDHAVLLVILTGQGQDFRSYLDRDPRWERRRIRFAHAIAFPQRTIAVSGGAR